MEEQIWFALSDIFVDNEIDFGYIASKIYMYSLEDIKYRLFYEIAPVYGSVYLTPVPNEWIGYDKNEFIKSIRLHIKKTGNSKIYKAKSIFLGKFYSFILKSVWLDLKKEIKLLKDN